MGSARDVVLQALEDLTHDEFKKFKLKLQTVELREGYGRIPRGQLQDMDAVDLTDKLISCYTERYGADLTASVLVAAGLQEQATRLRDALGTGPGTVPAPEAEPPRSAGPAVHFVDRHREALIQRVTNVDAVLDALYGKVLKEEEYQAVRAQCTSPNKMRALFSFTPSWSAACKDQLLAALRSTHQFLVADLEKS